MLPKFQSGESILVTERDFRGAGDVSLLRAKGVQAFLARETLMRA